MGLGRLLMIAGLILLVAGVMVTLGDRLPIKLGRLPGDFVWRGKNSVFYFPLMTSILLSIILTLILWAFSKR